MFETTRMQMAPLLLLVSLAAASHADTTDVNSASASLTEPASKTSPIPSASAAAASDASQTDAAAPPEVEIADPAIANLAQEKLVCKKEKPTGSHRVVKVCRAASAVEGDRTEVERTMNRMRHYGNPSVTPGG